MRQTKIIFMQEHAIEEFKIWQVSSSLEDKSLSKMDKVKEILKLIN